MDRKVPAPAVGERLAQAMLGQDAETAINQLCSADTAGSLNRLDNELDGYPVTDADILAQVSQLEGRAKVALMRRLLTQLETDQIQLILESGLREIGERHRRGMASSAALSHSTRLVLKKDYSYQDRGLSQPTQYYVYLRLRKPKLDRYIGALFYLPQGCALSYFMNAEGHLVFNPPHNIFQLRDYKNPTHIQVVRLVSLEPPPRDYTFTKQQHDTPAIALHLEYLDPETYQAIAQEAYPFPACMHEGGKLDRYRWEVSTVMPGVAIPAHQEGTEQALESLSSLNPTAPLFGEAVIPEPLSERSAAARPVGFNLPATKQPTQVRQSFDNADFDSSQDSAASSSKSTRRILELPPTKSPPFYLVNRADSDLVLKRMYLWAGWSEKAMPQAKWEIVPDGTVYTLINGHSKRRILKFSLDQAMVVFENSLPVLVKCFHDLGLAVSQASNQRRYSTAQLQLARDLFVDMSLPQNDALIMLKKIFGVEFSKNSTH